MCKIFKERRLLKKDSLKISERVSCGFRLKYFFTINNRTLVLEEVKRKLKFDRSLRVGISELFNNRKFFDVKKILKIGS